MAAPDPPGDLENAEEVPEGGNDVGGTEEWHLDRPGPFVGPASWSTTETSQPASIDAMGDSAGPSRRREGKAGLTAAGVVVAASLLAVAIVGGSGDDSNPADEASKNRSQQGLALPTPKGQHDRRDAGREGRPRSSGRAPSERAGKPTPPAAEHTTGATAEFTSEEPWSPPAPPAITPAPVPAPPPVPSAPDISRREVVAKEFGQP